ncbi:MAG: ROK family protein [Phycisphaerae bacterium]
MVTTDKYLLGFDIGGTKCAVVLGRSGPDRPELIDRHVFATESGLGPEPTLLKLEDYTRDMVKAQGVSLDQIQGLGISCGGPLDSRRGLVMSPPNLPGWDRIPIVERFRARLGISVRLQNDANACALAEWKWGAGRGTQNMIFLTFGTGLGAGLILDGNLYLGTSEMAGEVGHVRLEKDGPVGYGKPGSFEGFCSGGGIAQLARQVVLRHLSEGKSVGFCSSVNDVNQCDARLIGQAAQAGDPTALEIMTVVGSKLGYGLAILMDILNPEVIVIGSIFIRQHELLWPIAEQVIREEALAQCSSACRVMPAQLGEAIGDYACLSVVEYPL